MLDESDGITRPLLEKMSVDVASLHGVVASEIARLPAVSGGRQPGIFTCAAAKRSMRPPTPRNR